MKTFQIKLLLLLSYSMLSAQTYKIQYERLPNISYQLRNVTDTNIKERVSRYLNASKKFYELKHSDNKSIFQPIEKPDETGAYALLNSSGLNSYFKDFSKGKFYMNGSIQESLYVVSDSLVNLNWTFHDEYKDIIGYQCQRASSELTEGEVITAWFTDKIPIGNGPQLYGILDAVILELDSNNCKFTAIGLQKDRQSSKIEKSFTGSQISQREYDQKIKALRLELQMNNE